MLNVLAHDHILHAQFVELEEFKKIDSEEIIRIERPQSYTLDHQKSVQVKIKSKNIQAEGFSDAHENIALEKARSEAIERFTMKAYAKKTQTSDTSNAWACHFSFEQALENSLLELIERHLSLKAWEELQTFLVIPNSLWPKSILDWFAKYFSKVEFSRPVFALLEDQGFCSVSVYLFNNQKNCICAHASAKNLHAAMTSAFHEALRGAHSALRFEYYTQVLDLHNKVNLSEYSPGAHQLAYAYTYDLPDNIPFKDSSKFEILSKWKIHSQKLQKIDLSNFEVLVFKFKDRYIVRTRSPFYKNTYWGPPKDSHHFINPHPHNVG